ncbi:OmpW family protein [Methylosinus sp. Sm6]|uniref:OmpW/AlkL family protein n=1 Tax=Methylosinus sp. Sm6 TaxID=2866948 RepID=UPI001C998506|nr:OmpW family outer membrane protein [Methylosinus sp. Sm6]MBY6240883.1 OmpW family protein [Methylosinus sp. Sm6]
MRALLRGALAALMSGAMGAAAHAADLSAIKEPPPPPPPAFTDTYQPFQIRLRAAAVVPDSGSATVYDGQGGGALQALGLSAGRGSVVPGASTSISYSIIPELDVSYYLTKNIAIEAICCISRHHVQGIDTLFGASLSRTWVFPPSLILQYHFTNFGAFQPYVGVGVNYTAYFSDAGNNRWFLTAAGIPVTFTSLSITPSWGVVGQIGFDYMLTENFGVNVDLKRILMEPNAHGQINVIGTNTYVPIDAKVNIDPWIASVGLTFRFGAGLVAPVLAKY